MKKLLVALALCFTTIFAHADYAGDPRFPTFVKNGVKFQCTIQAEFGSVNVLYWNGNSWVSWGGTPDRSGEILGYVDDTVILSHGSFHGFVTWIAAECERRADLFSAIPLPSSNRIERFNYAMKMLLKTETVNGVDHIKVPAAPLP